jgi:hypothetical protein
MHHNPVKGKLAAARPEEHASHFGAFAEMGVELVSAGTIRNR